MKKIIFVIKSFLWIPLNRFTKLIPRDKNIWVYGSFGNKFLDNSKYLFLEGIENDNNVKHIWLTNSVETERFLCSKGLPCYRVNSLKGIYYNLRAKVCIYSAYPSEAINYAFSGGIFKFNLWHGLPLKKIEFDIKVGSLQKMFNPASLKERIIACIPLMYKKSDAVLCPLNSFKEIFKGAFKVKESNVCLATYPRTYPFFWSEKKLLEHIDKYEPIELMLFVNMCKEYKEVWIYMPTWRDANPSFLNNAIPDFNALDEVCKKRNILFLLKLHVNTEFSFAKEKWENIVVIPNFLDIYPLLPFTSTLLTDYSSIFFDYRLLKKNIVFYPFDLIDYLSKSREMYFEYDIQAKEDKVYSFRELKEYMEMDNREQFSGFNSSGLCEDDFRIEIDKIKNFVKDNIFKSH